MRRILSRLAFVLLLALVAAGCVSRPPDTLTQVGAIDGLLAGVYDGEVTCGALRRHGNFGIGTFDKLDGEMILLDDVVYQARTDGKVYRAPDELKTPFATVVTFTPDFRYTLPEGCNFAGMETFLDQAIPTRNAFYAIRIEGRLRALTYRSVPAQTRPYPPLAKVTESQAVFNLKDAEGTLVGFRAPPFVKGLNVPGYHLHFISRDRQQGGHVLALELATGTVELDVNSRAVVLLPEHGDFLSADLARERTQELQKVEKGR